MFVELISHVERSMHEVAHVFPAVDHLARQPPRPTAADAERIKALLATEASVELRDAFERWCACEREFLEAAAQLEAVGRREAESDYQSELERDIAVLRARRAELLDAAEELRERVARELDA
jgi:signal transduction histidine kinase